MTVSRRTWAAIAAVVSLTFFLLALRGDVYNATSPPSISHSLLGPGLNEFAHPWWLSVHFWLRKLYSVGAFAIVGLCWLRALEPESAPRLRITLLVAGYSLAIEIAQYVFVWREPLLGNVLDVACGALGGWLAVVAAAAASPNRRYRTGPRVPIDR